MNTTLDVLQREKPELYKLLNIHFMLQLRKELLIPLLKDLCMWLHIKKNIEERTYKEYFTLGRLGQDLLNRMLLRRSSSHLLDVTYIKTQVMDTWADVIYDFTYRIVRHE